MIISTHSFRRNWLGEKVAKDSLSKKCHKTSQNVKGFAVAFCPCGSPWEERGFY